MMAHYSNNEGIVIAYHRETVEEGAGKLFWEVDYVKRPPVIDMIKMAFDVAKSEDKRSGLEYLATKHEDWGYEGEYRMISSDTAPTKYSLPDRAIKGVCLTPKASEATENILVEICSSRDIPVYRAKSTSPYEYTAELLK